MDQEEIWKDIKGYEGLYQVSSLGRVRSLPHVVPSKAGSTRISPGKIMKNSLNKCGYVNINLCKENQKRKILVHRIVAFAFIYKPHNRYQINHKDGNKQNNTVENLEWCNQSENQKHAYIIGLQKPIKGKDDKRSIPIIQLSLTDEKIREFDSMHCAQNKTGIRNGNISKVCSGNAVTAGGFKWMYKSDYDKRS